MISIRPWTQPFPAQEGVAVVFDIFRCSTTVHCLAHHGFPLYVAPSLELVQGQARLKEMRVFSELSQPSDCLERFDNSPLRALAAVGGPALVATTTGTPAMFAAKNFQKVYVGSLVSFSALVRELAGLDCPITLIPAAHLEWQHVEDDISAQAMATALEGFANLPDFVSGCAAQAKEKILASPRPAHLAQKLITGAEDVAIALEVDRFDQVLSLEFEANGLFAKVVKR
jgi:phosphosulfolactate phosphohydrolase-like enzyme